MESGNPSLSARATSTALPSPGSELIHQTLGDFLILRCLGQGGMGQVFLAEQQSLKRKVALKILKAELASDPNALKRFRAEAEAVAKIVHANIVQVYAIGESNGLHYMAMEFVEGRNLREFLARKGTLEVPVALSVMRQVAAGLMRAGEVGIVHRDIKPDNILLTRKGEVKIADFGLSRVIANDQETMRLTQTGVALGTPLYMSPEQVQGKPVDARTDIYSFGVTCYHMLGGEPPFRGETAFEVAIKHVHETAPLLGQVRPDLPAELCAIVDRMMGKKPEERYPSARDLLKDLNKFRESLSGVTAGEGTRGLAMAEGDSTPTHPSMAVVRPSQKRRWLTAAVPLSLLLALAGGGLAGWRYTLTSNDGKKIVQNTNGTSHKDHEKLWLQEIKEYEEPKDGSEIRDGLAAQKKLAWYYFEHERYHDAEVLFSELVAKPKQPVAYKNFENMMLGIVFSCEDEPRKSNEAFLTLPLGNKDEQKLRNRLYYLGDPEVRKKLLAALKQNEDKEGPLPEKLKTFRKMLQAFPNFTSPGSRTNKNPGKKS